MLREELAEALKTAVKARESRRVSTLRLVLAALKDRDIAARGAGRDPLISDEEILNLLQTMIKQRRESIRHYEEGSRMELAEQEQEEIVIIREFMPEQMTGEKLEGAARAIITELEACALKDMGRVMGALKQRYAGRMDFASASSVVKQILAG